MSIVQSGTSGACIAMSRAISSWRSSVRIRPTIVELRVARASARWNFRSSCRNRSSLAEEVVAAGELALALDRPEHHGEVVLGGVHRGELGHARLEQPARLEHAGDLAEADLLAAAQQLARHQLRGDEDAAGLAAPHLEHAGLRRAS